MSWQPTALEQQRLDKIAQIRAAGLDPYPLRVNRTHTSQAALNAFEEAVEDETVDVTVCGRLSSVRDMGKSVFAHIVDEFGRIQLFLRRGEVGEASHQIFRKLVDLPVPLRPKTKVSCVAIVILLLIMHLCLGVPLVYHTKTNNTIVYFLSFLALIMPKVTAIIPTTNPNNIASPF